MTKTLTLDEMLDCLEMLKDPAAPALARALEAVGDLMAGTLARTLNVEFGATRREESAFAGTCATFWPKVPGQVCPEPLAMYDATEWIEIEDDTATPEQVERLTDAGWAYESDGWHKVGGILKPGPNPEGLNTAEALAEEFGSPLPNTAILQHGFEVHEGDDADNPATWCKHCNSVRADPIHT